MHRIQLIRRGSDVTRYHTWPTVGPDQNNGHHTYNMVAMLLQLHPNPPIALIEAIMLHDVPEERFGDAPSPGLWADGNLKAAYDNAHELYLLGEFGTQLSSLTSSEQRWLLALDKLEAFYFAQHQMKLGNFYAHDIVTNLIRWFSEQEAAGMIPAPVLQVVEALQEEIRNGL